MAKENSIEKVCVNFFAMSEDYMYSFEETLILNVMIVKQHKEIFVVNRDFDLLFIGVGNTRNEAIADWKMKFHYFFQRFSRLGTRNPFEDKMFRIMQNIIDTDAYDRNATTNRIVLGTIEDCRFEYECPCSFRLEGSDELCEVPSGDFVDPSFILLKKGDRFRGVFEYRDSDNKLLRIHYAMPIPKKNWE
ncbi:MAG: hypothetical protein IKS45_03840 [Thermoguttaceae bacterium]|nr:hypothetical protein [Thermoguttaceae bacterium]